jgi:hypothetical protein
MSLELKIEELTKQIVELNATIAKIINPMVVETTKEEKTTPTIPEVETEVVEPPKVKVVKAKKEVITSLTLTELKDSAKNAVGRSSREKVKECISKYADKLSDVAEADYTKLYNELEVL